MTSPLLAVEGISKHFGGIQALSHVTLDIQAGEVLAICGENGAGKSTLVKILMGIYQSYTGSIFSEGKEVKVRSPADGQALGIALVSQELSLAPDLSVADNIWLGSRRVPLFHRREALRRRAADTMAMLGFGGDFIDGKSLALTERQFGNRAQPLP
jgi:ABC-type sugar transport system ATPase subunit